MSGTIGPEEILGFSPADGGREEREGKNCNRRMIMNVVIHGLFACHVKCVSNGGSIFSPPVSFHYKRASPDNSPGA